MNTLTEAQRERVLALLREGKTLRRIEHETGHRRETIAAYGRRAGLLDGEVAQLDAVREPESVCEPHADLARRFGFPGSYSTLKRYARNLRPSAGGQTMMLAA